MEVPTVEDSMEMASPYQGQADDFDIDIDLMEDHVSNMDSEMMGADDYPETSHASLFATEANGDADMADGLSEGSMVDADLVDQDQDVDIQFEETTYEADMLEDDHVEVISVPGPSIQVESHSDTIEEHHGPSDVPAHAVDVQAVPAQEGSDNVLSVSEPIENELAKVQPGPQSQEEAHAPEEGPLEPADDVERDKASEGSADYHKSESHVLEDDAQGDPSVANDDQQGANVLLEDTVQVDVAANEKEDQVEVGNTDANAPASQTEAERAAMTNDQVEVGDEVDLSVEAGITEEVEVADESGRSSTHETGTTTAQEPEDQNSLDEEESLHPVKVLYQDAEISLFPPLEGDSSETFFLHDEEIAYEHIGKLFKSLREVLLDNVAENEVLVIDIDSLGIQLTEDSSHMSSLTLHRILNVYLRLCHNDGNSEPEAFYLTLSTRLAVSSELAALEAAAGEGKGLSQIHPWSEYEDGEDGEDGHAPEATDGPVDQMPRDQDRHHSSHVGETPSEPVAPATTAEQNLQDTVHVEEPRAVEDVLQHTSGDQSNGLGEPGTSTTAKREVDEAGLVRDLTATVADVDDSREEEYDSEARKTESTSTLMAAPDEIGETESTGDSPHEIEEQFPDEHEENFDHGDEHVDDVENLHDPQLSEQVNLSTFDEGGRQDAHGEDGDGDLDHNAEVDAKVHVVDFAAVDGDSVHAGEDDPALVDQNASADTLHDDIDDQSGDQSESTVQAPSNETLGSAASPEHKQPEVTADPLKAHAEEFEESPDEENGDSKSEHEHYQFGTSTNDVDVGEHDDADHGDGDDNEDDHDILVFTEHIEVGEEDSASTDPQVPDKSTKRSREEEDEWGFEESSGLDTKRRRPS
ncbi:hypothetical protein POX_c03963 [Penicillium oxalicum]|uniref:hypothetical protein n=1 Tax=Penicillium oxalicum TaxID=69781 RepID=UPI0020B8B41B|nr:hypothetical protein POX_c03963 [Penicillium oxalicum]KAI2791108.1 hypothetical protein POX_c03963 [Penicillium oxalicum]